MNPTNTPQEPAFGYLATWDSPPFGSIGGYLVVSALGRPLEFHCTAPVQPSRAQQILYGPTLLPYLYGEQIGGTLLAEAKLRPLIVLTDHPATLCLRPRAKVPMAHLVNARQQVTSSDAPGGNALSPVDHEEEAAPSTNRLVVAHHEFELPSGFASDRDKIVELLTLLAQRIELAEPFERIREAIREAQRLGERDEDSYEPAAA